MTAINEEQELFTFNVKNSNKNLREEVTKKTQLVRDYYSLSNDFRITISGEEFIGESLSLEKFVKERDDTLILFEDIEGFVQCGYEVSIFKKRKKNSLTSYFDSQTFVNGGVLHINFQGNDFYNYTVCHQNDKTEVQYNIWLIDKNKLDSFALFLKEFKEFKRKQGAMEKQVTVFGGENYTVSNFDYTWDDIILPNDIKQNVRESVDFWFNNEQWYRDRKFPYKRGILIHGYPGNGKTFLTKIIISKYDLNIIQFNFGNPQLGNTELIRAFKQAKDNAPALFLLEDIDRVFSKHEKQVSPITIDALFNCLDGIEELDGVLVVATANHPEDLDSAIINRPSRFDTVIELSNPTLDQRFRYLSLLFKSEPIKSEFLQDVARRCPNEMSMAFLKEIYFRSVITALSRNETLNNSHVEESLTECTKHFKSSKIKKGERAAGFGSGF